jgi:organic hydroperoxide reductase OsmC/OhrA
MSEEHLFSVAASFVDDTKEGTVANGDGTFSTRYTGAPALGGKGGATNPEELLLSAVGACFANTWAIFIAKLKLPIAVASVDAACAVTADPAGGFHVTAITLTPKIPAGIWQERRADVAKSLQLAEKYCIVSKAVTRGVANVHVALPAD